MAITINYIVDKLTKILHDEGTFVFDERVSGFADGTRKMFRLKDYPVEEGNTTIFVNSSEKREGADFNINSDSGLIVFTTAPALSSNITANYNYYTYNRDVLNSCVIEGFNKINSELELGLSEIVLSKGSYVLPRELESEEDDMVLIASMLSFLQNESVNDSMNSISHWELGFRISFGNVLKDKQTAIAITNDRLNSLISAYTVGNMAVYRVEAAEAFASLAFGQ